MSIRPKIEAALAATAERLHPGSGADAVHQSKNDLVSIEGTSDDISGRYANAEIVIAAPAVYETKHPDGDPVTIKKRHDGLIVVYPDGFIYVHAMALGLREVKALGKDEVSVEPITMVLDGAEVPGLRITGRAGRPKFALAIAPAKESGDPAEQVAIRDEIHRALAG
ncbi:MAG: hypothetical protein ACOYOP_07445 [Microthrixaceae bacterium]